MAVVHATRPVCTWCGKLAEKVLRLKVPCPLCGVDVETLICPECAAKLIDVLRMFLQTK